MKKYMALILSLVLAVSIVTAFPTRGLAAEEAVTLPDFEYPTMSCQTFAETGIPYDALMDAFPETLEIKYENGTLYVKDLGGDEALFFSDLNHDTRDGELVDGYWTFAVSAEEYNSDSSISMRTDSHSWHAEYKVNGKRWIVTLTKHMESNARIVMLYPEEGYGEQYIQVAYDLLAGFRVTDSYDAGVLKEQVVEVHDDDSSLWAYYDAQGNPKYVNVSENSEGRYASYIPGKGWSENSWEYVPTNAPAGYENATLESLLAMGPTDIGCKHQWEGPLCDVPAICALCHREKGEPIGHSWVSGTEYDTCSTCNGILYRVPKMEMPVFEGRPYQNLETAGVNADAITSKLPQKITTKYENGIFMIPNIDGYVLDVDLETEGFVKYRTENGWNLMEVAEEDLAALDISFSKLEEKDDGEIWHTLRYSADGCPVSVNMYDAETDKSITVSLKDKTVKLSYLKDKDSDIEYTDVYENGVIAAQNVYDLMKSIRVYYDSDLKVSKVKLWEMGKSYTFTPGKGWTVRGADGATAEAPEGYADKDAAYFAQAYPHNIDFCIHSFETSEDGSFQKCAKCGQTVALKQDDDPDPDSPVVLFVVGGVILAAAAAGIIIVVNKKKKQTKE